MRIQTPQIPLLSTDHGQLMELLEDLSQRVENLKQWEADHDQQVQSLSTQLQKTNQTQEAIRVERELLSRRLARVARVRALWKERHQSLTRDQEQFSQSQEQFALNQERLSQDQARLNQTQQRLETQQRELATQQQQLEALKNELEQKIAQQQQQSQALTQELQTRRLELEHERQAIQTQAAQIAEQTQAIQVQREQLQLETDRIAEERASLQTQQAEAREAIEAQLAQAAAARAAELQIAPTVEPEQIEVQLEPEETTPSPASSATLSELAQREADVRQQESELEFKIQAQNEKMRVAREKLKAECAEFEAKHDQLKQQAKIYNGKLGTLREAYAVFKARRKRLHRYRELLSKQTKALREAQNKVASLHQQYAGLLQNRQNLLEVKQFLTTSEERMVQQWATHGSVGSVVGVMLVLLLMAIFSYAVGEKSTQPIWRATQSMEIKLVDEKGTASPAAPDQWAQTERATLLNEAVLGEALSQMAQRGISGFTTPQAFHDELEKTLVVKASRIGLLELEYRQADKQLAVQVLEALGRARLAYQMVQDRQAHRSDSVKILQAAMLDASPVVDQRWTVTLSIFGGLLVAAVLMIFALRLWMLRAKRVLVNSTEPSLRELQDIQVWPDMPQPPAMTQK